MAPFIQPGLVQRATPVLGILFHSPNGVTVLLLEDGAADQQSCYVLKVIGRKHKAQVYLRVYLKARFVWLNDFLKRCFERDGRKFPRKGSILLHYVVWYLAGRTAPCGFEIHHINGNHLDNRLENLELLTHAEHAAHHNWFPRVSDDLAQQPDWVKVEGEQTFTRRVEFDTRYHVHVLVPKWRIDKGSKRIHNSGNDCIADQLRELGWRPARVANAVKVLAALVKARSAELRSTHETARSVGLSLPSLRSHLLALSALGYVDAEGSVFRPTDGLREALQRGMHSGRSSPVRKER